MATDYIIHSFGAGELSEQLLFRGDFEKYELGVSLARNWFIDYRGGASTRAGTKFVCALQHDDKEIIFTKFQFSPDAANSYVIILGDNYIRFIQNDGYVLEAPKTITGITQASPGVVTAAAHGFSNGDYVEIGSVAGMVNVNSRQFWVKNVTTNTFTLHDSVGNAVDTTDYPAYTSGGQVSRIYTVDTDYAAEDLASLSFNQVRNELRITSIDFTPQTLTRNDQTDWTLTPVNSIDLPNRPGTPAITPSGAGTAGFIGCVTAVDALGRESLPTRAAMELASVNYTTEAGSSTWTWTASPDAVYYNIYRSVILADSNRIHAGFDMGYIGKSLVPEFTDNNIIPDYTKAPPTLNTPFADGVIQSIDITAAGSGYNRDTGTTVFSISTSTGAGFIGYPIVNGDGEVVGAKIISGGRNFADTDTISITGGGGSGATATLTVSAQDGNNPALSLIHQQRQVYAAPENAPLTVYGSQTKLYDNFNSSDAQNANESYEFEIDSEEVTPIRHILSAAGGMLVMSDGGVWLVTGEDTGKAITPQSALATPQSYIGVSETRPLKIGEDIIYVEAVGSTVRLLGLNQYSDSYRGEDISILSNHFFKNNNYITEWAYAADPFKIVWAVRTDGLLLGLTIVREHKVLAWTLHATKGYFRHVMTLREAKTSSVYFIVERQIGGTLRKFVEKQASRIYDYVDDAWCLDSALATDRNYPNASISFSAATGVGVTATCSSGIFSSSSVGAYIRCGTGRALVKQYLTSTTVSVDIAQDIPVIPETTVPRLFSSGTWSYDETFSVLRGLDHLEGQTISVLGDGAVFADLVVTNGAVTLPVPVTYAVAGLSYKCRLKTLPPSVVDGVIEDKNKKNVGMAFRHHETRGLKIGEREEWLDDVKFDPPELGNIPTPLQSALAEVIIDGSFTTDGQVIFAQDDPLPATVLGYVLKIEVGDDN